MTTTAHTAEASELAVDGAAYVYGVTRAATSPPRAEGIGGAGVRTVAHGSVAALVTDVPSANVRARRRDLHRHAEVLRTALEQAPVLPLRFGTVFGSDEDVVVELLEARHDELAALLNELDGLVELTVRALYDEEAVLRAIVRDDGRVAALRRSSRADPGSALELGEAVAHALAARREQDADGIVSALAPLAREVVSDECETELEVLRAAFLVDAASLGAFDAAMDALARRHAETARFKYVGPLPPYHFVSGDWRG